MKTKTFHLLGTLVIAVALLAATTPTASAQTPTPTLTPTPTPALLPDLVVHSLSPVWVGESSYNVNFYIHNQGTASAGASTVGVYVDGILQDSGSIPSLNVGQAGLILAGTYTISGDGDTVLVRADISDQVVESDEENNSESIYVSHDSTGGDCFIATAASGDPDSDASVQTLRSFRDNNLLNNSVGSSLVNTYYNISPPVAGFIDDHPALKPSVRIGLLPSVGISDAANGMALPVKIGIMVMLVVVTGFIMFWFRRRATSSS